MDNTNPLNPDEQEIYCEPKGLISQFSKYIIGERMGIIIRITSG